MLLIGGCHWIELSDEELIGVRSKGMVLMQPSPQLASILGVAAIDWIPADAIHAAAIR